MSDCAKTCGRETCTKPSTFCLTLVLLFGLITGAVGHHLFGCHHAPVCVECKCCDDKCCPKKDCEDKDKCCPKK